MCDLRLLGHNKAGGVVALPPLSARRLPGTTLARPPRAIPIPDSAPAPTHHTSFDCLSEYTLLRECSVVIKSQEDY